MPFLTIEELGLLWQPIAEPQKPLASLLLETADGWIRTRAPHIQDDSPAAKLVVLQVVRSAMTSGTLAGHVSYSKAIGPWSKSGTLANPEGYLKFTDEHYALLGIVKSGEPHWYFGDGEEGICSASP